MIIKFNSEHINSVIEVQKSDYKEISVFITNNEDGHEAGVFLNEQSIFLLIGQLLRLQSEIKKEVSNG